MDLIQDIINRQQIKTTKSHLLDVRDAVSSSSRTSSLHQVLEDGRSQQEEVRTGQPIERNRITDSLLWRGSISQSLATRVSSLESLQGKAVFYSNNNVNPYNQSGCAISPMILPQKRESFFELPLHRQVTSLSFSTFPLFHC